MSRRDRDKNRVRNTPQQLGRKIETAELRRIGAVPRPASGAVPGLGGDGIDDAYVYEHKFTGSRSYRMRADTWVKIRKEAAVAGRLPAMLLLVQQDRFRLTAWDPVEYPLTAYPRVCITSCRSISLSMDMWADVVSAAKAMHLEPIALLDFGGLHLHMEKV